MIGSRSFGSVSNTKSAGCSCHAQSRMITGTTTSPCAALRATELACDVLLEATKVDGVYDADPRTTPGATRFDHLTFSEAMERDLRIMDITALAMCREHHTPVLVFNFDAPGNIRRVIEGESIGTYVHNG